MSFHDILYGVEDGVALIRFNRPDQLNAARMETHAELIRALDMADADDAVRAVVVTGEGRAFCAGTDLASGGFDLPEGGDPATGEGVPPDVGGVTVLRLYDMRKPVIGAMNGAAVGFGLTFTLGMDIRIVAEDAKLAFPFTRRGICAESCCSWFLPRIVGLEQAMEWMLSGRTFLGKEAAAKGLALQALPAADVLPRAMDLAREIAAQTSAPSVAVTRALLLRGLGAAHPAEAHAYESRAISACLAGPDAAEGVAAFKARRAPAFTGRVAETDYMQDWEAKT
ncbi:enoyl-CoA hydratase-related protein [Palleronia abyssalis]|uniref:4-chlorobenzoyl coenzyme A dehalogenase-2 n=1 Tax=Palleronia abyssalis TaxID=1501240 RepID=A0A2R8BUR9_9RHOB|nr:enoyl-CoA hydratase-related protein [Palleronia abyssalis]SPJ23914.1 4-chlorobenzoyl coenzyme A dehalogenase-2 [Palleronia abyssalis]